MTNQQPLLDRIRDLEATVFSLETKLAVRGYEEQIDDLQGALFQAQNAAIDLAKKVEKLETQLAQAVWNYGEAKREVLMEREACAKICKEITLDMWNLYKGKPPYKGDEAGRASDFTQGRSAGAEDCLLAIIARGDK